MPKICDRKLLLSETVERLAVAVSEEEEDDEWHIEHGEDSLLTLVKETQELLLVVKLGLCDRQLLARRKDFAHNHFHQLSDGDFRQLTRTSKQGFAFIVNEVRHQAVKWNASCFFCGLLLVLEAVLDWSGIRSIQSEG